MKGFVVSVAGVLAIGSLAQAQSIDPAVSANPNGTPASAICSDAKCSRPREACPEGFLAAVHRSGAEGSGWANLDRIQKRALRNVLDGRTKSPRSAPRPGLHVRVWREPVMQFLAVGAVLFPGTQWFDRTDAYLTRRWSI